MHLGRLWESNCGSGIDEILTRKQIFAAVRQTRNIVQPKTVQVLWLPVNHIFVRPLVSTFLFNDDIKFARSSDKIATFSSLIYGQSDVSGPCDGN